MKQLFSLYRRNGIYYAQNNQNGKQESLRTRDEAEAKALLHSKNEAARQPILNRQIALAYLSATDPAAAQRTWKYVMGEMLATKTGVTRHRYGIAWKDPAFELISEMPLLMTNAEHLLKVLRTGTVSTNNYLRRLHNFAVEMNWLPKSIVPRHQWPKAAYKEKRAITQAEHDTIIANEKNAEEVDWEQKTIGFFRRKTGTVARLHFGPAVSAILQDLPGTGPLFPCIATMSAGDRSTQFRKRCHRLNITGVTLHSYRYAWAERAKTAGYPERYAQEALGHKSQAVHRSYAKRAKMLLPTLEDY